MSQEGGPLKWYWMQQQGDQNRDEPVGNQLRRDPEGRVELFVREVLQNALDARIGEDPAEVDFDFVEMSGQALADFRNAIRSKELLRHMKAEYFTEGGQPDAQDLEAVESGPLFVLRITDYNTKGLYGPEKNPREKGGKRTPYASLTKDLFTANPTVDAGGSYGIGKSVLWMFNQTRTVLFLSRIKEDLLAISERPSTSNGTLRFIGRAELRQRSIEGVEYLGSGWLCSVADEGTKSSWDLAPETLTAMGFAPELPDFGTQMVIAGVSREMLPSELPRAEWKRLLSKKLIEECAKWFWPAIERKRLTVRVGRVEVQPSDCLEYAPFVRLVSVAAGEKVPYVENEHLSEVAIPVPGSLKEPVHGECEQVVPLVVKRIDQGNDCTVALFRYPGMVVQYWSEITTQGNGKFIGVLPCGTFFKGLEGSSKEAEFAQYFLRMSENEVHDQWTPASRNLEGRYPTGTGKRTPNSALGKFRKNLRDAVGRIVVPPPSPTDKGKSKLFAGFRLPADGEHKDTKRSPEIKDIRITGTSNGAADFLVTISPRRAQTLSLSALLPTDERPEPLKILEIEVLENGSIVDGRISVEKEAQPVRLTVKTSLSGAEGMPVSSMWFEVHGSGVAK